MSIQVTVNRTHAGTYDIAAYGEQEFRGVTFASIMSEYIAECNTHAVSTSGNRNLRQAALRTPFAIYEQAMLALWGTVPKYGLSPRWETAVSAVGLVMNFFNTGDKTLFDTSLDDCGFIKAGEQPPLPFELLERFEVLMATVLDPVDFVNAQELSDNTSESEEYIFVDEEDEDEDEDEEADTATEDAYSAGGARATRTLYQRR